MLNLSLYARLLALVALAGCNDQAEESVPTPLTPPGIKSLADVDVADASYGEESIVIQGVVSPSSQGGWPGQNDDYKVHCFSFAAWRKLGEPIVKRQLTVLRPVVPGADYWDDFPKHSIQRISVLLSSDETRAVFEKALPVDAADEELQMIAAELQEPVVFRTDLFGDLILDRSINWFEAETAWNGETIRVTFPVDDEDEAPDKIALKTAETLWSHQAEWKTRIETCAVKELLELKNDTWLHDGESAFTAEQFIATMTLTSISISSDGEFEFWYDDGDLFCGHVIMVSGNVTDGPTDAGIHG